MNVINITCGKHSVGKAVMIEDRDDEFVYYKNVMQSERLPIVVYADFECILRTITELKNNLKHIMSYCFFVKINKLNHTEKHY